MSNLLEQASLVMIPSGYKEDVVYSVIPTSGAGDLTFTRASTGTRIDSDGNVEVVPWNLLEYSEQFDNAIWQQIGTTITANATTAPNGTTTAERYQASASARGVIYQTITIPAQIGVVCTFSVYGKVASGTQQLRIGADQSCSYPSGAKIITLTTEWQRFDVQVTSPSTNGFFNPFIDNITDNTNACAGTAINADCFIWGAQLNIGSTAKPYFPTTDRQNVPRLTYQNGGGGCPSLLLEKQSTNLFTYSQELQTGTVGTSTVTPNTAISPDGTQNADSLGTGYLIKQFGTPLTAGTYTFSTFAKYLGANTFMFYMYDGSYYEAVFNVSTGVVTSSTSGVTASIQNMGNGWYRCIITATTANNITEVGYGTANIYAWGAQLEASSYPTSYIPTTSSSATRVADACYKNSISSLIGQSSGVVFADIVPFQFLDGSYIGISDNASTSNRQIFGFEGDSGNSGTLRFYGFYTGSSITCTAGQRYKIAMAYANNDFVIYINGTQVVNQTSGTVTGTLSHFGFDSWVANSQNFQGQVNEAILFPTRLTNSELAQLTGNQNYTINQAYESYGVSSESPNCVQP